MVVIEGPRISTRAESQVYAAAGGTLINMTGAPEAALAREQRLCYAALALVTDMDRVLGRTAGNAVEVREAIDALRDPGAADPRLVDVTIALARAVLALGGLGGVDPDGVLRSGAAAEV